MPFTGGSPARHCIGVAGRPLHEQNDLQVRIWCISGMGLAKATARSESVPQSTLLFGSDLYSIRPAEPSYSTGGISLPLPEGVFHKPCKGDRPFRNLSPGFVTDFPRIGALGAAYKVFAILAPSIHLIVVISLRAESDLVLFSAPLISRGRRVIILCFAQIGSRSAFPSLIARVEISLECSGERRK